ncbi:uncharacterized protein PV09_04800 [Verruconis gallopava]|uniref:MADS-box domain-containing protein n=1 Tax=Verruconis gallopava TaxID=253628 RepID=A0A0D1XN08_9PEZI|nr:uncharacterized protein PV09_04800 [Verruconis gallopava]KIW03966.1 hypothetical protein PV09_04800 [Verruconis gallopava]
MGRRKIEIKAIKDDRNRSVTFLKRKGGLFKKAYELSVLCQVDVAVIIFGHNKKLYEFSSGDINEAIGRYQYYGGAHEHKGPEDFRDKKDGGSDDEDDDAEELPRESRSPPHPTMAHHLHGQPQFNHMGSASPPMPNGAFPHRGPSPQPPHNISRPGSRAHIRQPSQQHLMPPQHPGHMQVSQSPPQPNFAYMPNPPIYNPQAAAGMQQRPQPGQAMPPQFPPQFAPQPAHQHPQPHPSQHPQAQHPQIQQIYAQEQQRRSVPPQFPQQHPPPPPPQQTQEQRPTPQPQPSPQPPQSQFSSPPLPQPKPLPAAAKTHSIFTPIDDSRSLLAQHWDSSRDDPPRSDPPVKIEEQRSQSIDVATINRNGSNGIAPPPQLNTSQPQPQPQSQPQRTASTPIIPSIHAPHPPSRTNSLQSKPRGPRLTVQIPNEDEEDEKTTAATSPQATAAATRTPIDGRPGVVLPPPSPSASALLSAGASGPPNPFARPAPPGAVNGFSRSDIETPISALPSRFVSDQLLPSPSSFYADWFNSRDNNMLPSPLTFPTPVASRGTELSEEDERKRKLDDASNNTPEKRVKT